MFRCLVVCFALLAAQTAEAQKITVEVWKLKSLDGDLEPATDAAVRISRAVSLPLGPQLPPQIPRGEGPLVNQYILDGTPQGPLVDVNVRVDNASVDRYHSWVARDLRVEPRSEQKVIVQLFSFKYPMRAPQCFALKTQYELLFRTEQRLFRNDRGLEYDAKLKEVQRLARLNYADGILALPNPSRRDVQSAETNKMLDDMDEDENQELENMLDGLFDLYRMDHLARYAPSRWQTQYKAINGQRVGSEVQLNGTHGSYTTRDGVKHLLEDIDIVYEENDNGDDGEVITGNWRFLPGDETKGTFRWKVDGAGEKFEGYFERPGDRQRYPWSGERIPQPNRNDNESEDVSSNRGQPAPPVDGPVPAPPARRPRRISAPPPVAPAVQP